MFKRGVVIGKFYPPHRGHKYLIDTAKSQCEHLAVIVCWKKSQEISGVERARWIKHIHPDVEVKLLDDDRLAEDDSAAWAENTLAVLGYVPDAVFTSEAYGDPYASFMGAVHVLVDKERTHIPISGTMVRSNPIKYATFLEPVVRASFSRRVCVVGAESTGTTTLAKALAAHYKTVWVPEYGRLYSEGKLSAGDEALWRTEEFVTIAKAQAELEDSLAEAGNGLVICDTDAFATGVWHERYMGTRSSAVEQIGAARRPDLYLLTGDEIPFVQDGTRDGEHIRHDMHHRFIERLEESERPYLLIDGSKEERLTKAIAAIDAL
ncbi:MAG: AAA family ATPase [Candidatus Pacebacteria bacterium]|nr:AAA family ATPase [Candidatus Paceibacterota bacterium]MBP9840231.1 AAA family ATPase [Candidatus Paceibacterota bacterium]